VKNIALREQAAGNLFPSPCSSRKGLGALLNHWIERVPQSEKLSTESATFQEYELTESHCLKLKEEYNNGN
jgi:hypothetical protein